MEKLSGRTFTNEEMEDIHYIIRMFSHLTRKELARTICEGLSWLTPKGEYKINSCLELLEKLEAQQRIHLPEKRKTRPLGREQVKIGPQTEREADLQGTVSEGWTIELEKVRQTEEIRLWNEYVERYHLLGYKRPFGAHQRYFIGLGNEPKQRLGCMLFSASAWALSERDHWIGWNKEDRCQRLHLVVNNTRFLIFPWVKVKNLASKALSLAIKQVPVDWNERYGYAPVLLETFVDTQHYTGTCYRAANWLDLGLTAGRGRMDRERAYALSRKRIFVYPLTPHFRAHLCGEQGIGGRVE